MSSAKKNKLIVKDTKADEKTTKQVFNELLNQNIKLFICPLFAKSLVSIEGNISDKNVKIFALTNNYKIFWNFSK